MATSDQRQEAFKRGQRFGQHALANRAPRAVTPTMLNSGLGAFQADPELNEAFARGFTAGYPRVAADIQSGASMPPEEAQRRGWEAGEQAALGKQARAPANWYGMALGADQNDASQRQLFDQQFYIAYDKVAASLGVVGPGGQTAVSVLKKVTADEQKKVADPYGARQRELQFRYDEFDTEINKSLSSYASVDGGLAFLSEWKIAKAEFAARNSRQMSEIELEDSDRKLNEMRGRNAGLIAVAATKPFSMAMLPWVSAKPPAPMQQAQTNAPQKPGVAPAAGAGLFGLSRNATIGLGVVSLAAIGGGIYYAATRDEEGMEKGPDGTWRPKAKPLPPPPRPPTGR